MTYKRKTRDEYQIHGDYGQGYEEVCAEDTRKEARAGKRTYRALLFPHANKFSDLFIAAYFIPTDAKVKPAGARFVSGSRGGAPCGCMGGKRGRSERTPNTRSHYGGKFYGTYAVPCAELAPLLRTPRGENYSYSFEAIRREDGILILARRSDCIGDTWLALLDLSENIEDMFDDETRAFLAAERQAAVDAWGA